MATASSREARRRRIIDMSSDRMALITGKIKTLPSSSTVPIQSPNESCSPSISNQFDISTDSPANDNESFSFPEKHDEIDMTSGGTKIQEVLRKSETNAVHGSSNPTSFINRFFSPSKTNSAVAASETVRILCSIVFAIFPILSLIGFPIVNMIVSRPLYLLLLTNISIVLSLLLLQNQRGSGRTEQENGRVPLMQKAGGYDMAEQIGKTLEIGLVLQNVMNAILIDCSIYATTIVCCISCAQAMGL